MTGFALERFVRTRQLEVDMGVIERVWIALPGELAHQLEIAAQVFRVAEMTLLLPLCGQIPMIAVPAGKLRSNLTMTTQTARLQAFIVVALAAADQGRKRADLRVSGRQRSGRGSFKSQVEDDHEEHCGARDQGSSGMEEEPHQRRNIQRFPNRTARTTWSATVRSSTIASQR